jgi:2-dehydro-3-deoxyphosphogluconate aldolase/(4S)-4-hydroxy-2-oxoglutarate aldolase
MVGAGFHARPQLYLLERARNMSDIIKKISETGVVPVIAISDTEKAVPLAKALVAGGVPVAEITFRTAEGEEAIRRIAKEVPGILLGAGTVLTTQQVDRAISAGAKFAVSPGFNPKVVDYCISKGLPIFPGCSNPSDMEMAIERGLSVVKFFPAEQAGGLAYIKACAAPYTSLSFMPTGGINAGNLGKYLAFSKIAACGGSWMVTKELISAGNFDEITRLCKEAAEIVRAARA